MGKKIRKQAEEMGFTEFPLTEVYARPRTFRQTFATLVCDTTDVVRYYLRDLDPSFSQGRSGGARNTTHYFLAPQLRVYVEMVSKTVGRIVYNPANHVNQIKIYSKFKAHVVNIVTRLDEIFPDGMLRHMDWEKIEDKFIAFKEECVRTWNAWLAERPERQMPTQEEVEKIEAEQEEFDEELALMELDEEDKSKKFKKLFDKYRD